jgi:integrase
MNLWRERGFTHYTQKTYREAAVMVFRWAHDNEYIKRNPTKTAHKLRKPARPSTDEMMKRISRDHGTIPSPLDSKGNANWQRILTALPHWVEGKAARVNPLLRKPFAPFMLLLLVMYETGLRRSDAIIFRPDWILDRTDADGNRYGSYTCVQMKTGDFVTCIVPQYLVSLLRQQPLLPWKGTAARYEYHAEQAFRSGAGLFPFYDGARTEEYCNDVYLGRPLRRFGETLGFAGKNTLRPHRLRHSFAVNSLNRGVSIYDCKLLMGHSNISTTEKYTRWVTVVSDEAQKRAVACMMRQLEDARREIEARPEMKERALMARQEVYAHSPGLAIQ